MTRKRSQASEASRGITSAVPLPSGLKPLRPVTLRNRLSTVLPLSVLLLLLLLLLSFARGELYAGRSSHNSRPCCASKRPSLPAAA